MLARNEAHRVMADMWPKIIQALQPFLGQKIFNQGDCLSKKAKSALPELTYSHDQQSWYQTSRYSLYFYVKISFSVRAAHGDYDHSISQECGVCVGEIDGHTLKSIAVPYHLRTDYTTEEVRAARKRLEDAKKLVSDANSELHYFGEYDR